MSEQPFTPFPFSPSQPGPPPMPVDTIAAAPKKRGESRRLAFTGRRKKEVAPKKVSKPKAKPSPRVEEMARQINRTELNVSVFMAKLEGMDAGEIKIFVAIVKMLQELPFSSRENITDALGEVFV